MVKKLINHLFIVLSKSGFMEIRKVQMTGGSSYIITLPKEWVKASKIQKNDSLGLIMQTDGTLLITPKTVTEKISKTKEFDADKIDNATYLFRLLVGSYIMGYSFFIIKSKTRIAPFIRDCLIEFTQIAIGPEIIEESIKSITIKDLLNPIEMPFDKTIKRLYILVRTMHEDAISALKNKNISLAEDIVIRDRDVDRLQWLIARQSNIVLRDITLSKQMEVKQEEATFYFLISRLLERVGDHAVKIANNVPNLIEKEIDEKIIRKITNASNLSLEILINSINAWLQKDIKMANKTIDSIKNLISICEEINDIALQVKGKSYIALSYIAESIRRTGEYAGDISEIVINYQV